MNEIKGLTIKNQQDLTSIEASSSNQHGLIYITHGAPKNWVAKPEEMVSHTLAGLFKALDQIDDARIQNLMRDYGLVYRELEIDTE
ncbi:MAG: hypothetical protein CL756_02915 [Chloroflexi bacterium]|nr:hypothetical protein [Chloroflexota bacterium]|tara:strand:+ start:2304 stop:2561 length:258 start_codon:yes stop_codon:yes gene_type:complete